jgi:hypothetical protein
MFEKYDTDCYNVLTGKNLFSSIVEAYKQFKQVDPDAQTAFQLMTKYDLNKDGFINKREFYKIIKDISGLKKKTIF